MGTSVYQKLGVRGESSELPGMESDGPLSHWNVVSLQKSLHRVIKVNFESNPLERKDAEGPSLENEEHLDVDSCDSDSPKNVNNDSVSPSSRFCRRMMFVGWKVILWTLEEGGYRDDWSCKMKDVTPVIAPEKDSIIAPPSTPPGNDLNIAAESGSSWIDYIGPLTSDEIDSDKR
ncbi:hypothetical protein Tco_0909924 [Tanacetum coccineum]|uniref:Uncharacterized protein n=1 Tax=Tanacetum coccineum TaxID=301880 RepID=A0ABQ5CYJ6_9ASTR